MPKMQRQQPKPSYEGLMSVGEAAEALGVSRTRIYQLGKAIEESAHDPEKPEHHLVLVCPLDQRPRGGKRSYRTVWVDAGSVLRYSYANRQPGPKGITYEERFRRAFGFAF